MGMHIEKERGEDFWTYIQRKTALVAYVEGLKDALKIIQDCDDAHVSRDPEAELRHRIAVMES